MADPMTTIRDPNPATCSHFSGGPRMEESIWDMEPPTIKWQDAPHQRQTTEDTCDTSNPDSESPFTGALGPPCTGFEWKMSLEKINSGSTTLRNDGHPGEHAEDSSSKDSIASVCKRDNRDGRGFSKARSDADIPDFVTFCRMNEISTIVRTNSGQEEGLVEDGGSYHPSQVYRNGIRHVDLFVNDTKGSLPSVEVIRQFLDLAHQMGLLKENAEGISDKSPALLVHCKSGFGRSVLLACCLIIFAYNVPGRAVLGWARLVRPGAITVREQELFLCDLNGREDLERIIEEARPTEPCSGEMTCQSCCSVQ
jgi:protein-tyrosine phosphatase